MLCSQLSCFTPEKEIQMLSHRVAELIAIGINLNDIES